MIYTIKFDDCTETTVGSRDEAEQEILMAHSDGVGVDLVIDEKGNVWYCNWSVQLENSNG